MRFEIFCYWRNDTLINGFICNLSIRCLLTDTLLVTALMGNFESEWFSNIPTVITIHSLHPNYNYKAPETLPCTPPRLGPRPAATPPPFEGHRSPAPPSPWIHPIHCIENTVNLFNKRVFIDQVYEADWVCQNRISECLWSWWKLLPISIDICSVAIEISSSVSQ